MRQNENVPASAFLAKVPEYHMTNILEKIKDGSNYATALIFVVISQNTSAIISSRYFFASSIS